MTETQELTIPNNLAVTGRILSWLKEPLNRLPVSCTVFVVEDSMEEEHGIEDSWIFTSKALRNAAGVAIHLSNLRPKGTVSSHGLIASGPVSFAQIYSKINEILRRGGAYRNGAITLHLDYDHPDALDFIKAPREVLPWAKRCLNVDDNFVNYPYLSDVISAVRAGDLWLVKKQFDKEGKRLYHNVCVSGDTLVMTTEGPVLAKDLVGKQFTTLVTGTKYTSTERGMWSNGYRNVVQLETKEGFTLKATPDHKIKTKDGWKKLEELNVGEQVLLQHHCGITSWSGKGNRDEGWLLGWLLGDGTYSSDETARLDFYGTKAQLFDEAMEKLDRVEVNHFGEASKRRAGQFMNHKTALASTGLASVAKSYDVTKQHKKATVLLETTSSEFHIGFLQAYFDADGSVNLGDTKTGSDKCISVTSVELENLQMIQRMLLRFGIRSRIWKNKYNGNMNMLPDEKGSTKAYQTRLASRLDISGQDDLRTFHGVIGFSFEEKQEKLTKALSLYNSKRASYDKPHTATVSSIVDCGREEVFDCTIPEISEFDGNGFHVHNCLEVNLFSKGTCLLSHVNLGSCTLDEIETAFEEGMEFLCSLHPQTGVGDSGIYLSPKKDRQIGLGVLGLANLLAIEEVTYKEFTETLEKYLNTELDTETIQSKAYKVVEAISAGFNAAARVAKANNMDRAFVVAPTATCSYNYTDREGYTTTAEIAPPIDREVDRDSETLGVKSYKYNPRVEIASEVGWDIFFRLNDAWQRLMDKTGLAHAISTNWWSDMVEMDKTFIERWSNSSLKSLYYSLQVMPATQDKSSVYTGMSEDISISDFSILGLSDPDDSEVCLPCLQANPSYMELNSCSACAE